MKPECYMMREDLSRLARERKLQEIPLDCSGVTHYQICVSCKREGLRSIIANLPHCEEVSVCFILEPSLFPEGPKNLYQMWCLEHIQGPVRSRSDATMNKSECKNFFCKSLRSYWLESRTFGKEERIADQNAVLMQVGRAQEQLSEVYLWAFHMHTTALIDAIRDARNTLQLKKITKILFLELLLGGYKLQDEKLLQTYERQTHDIITSLEKERATCFSVLPLRRILELLFIFVGGKLPSGASFVDRRKRKRSSTKIVGTACRDLVER